MKQSSRQGKHKGVAVIPPFSGAGRQRLLLATALAAHHRHCAEHADQTEEAKTA